MGKVKKRVSISRKGRKSAGMVRPLILFLLAIVILGGIALMVSYFYLKRDRQTEPALSELKLTNHENEESTGEEEANQDGQAISHNKKSELQANTWVSTLSGAMLTFEGNRFTIDFPSVESQKAMVGSVSFTDKGFMLTNQGNDDICGKATGEYGFQLNGEDLVITTKKDSCRKRSATLEAVWFKL
jgi:hypothetical protein